MSSKPPASTSAEERAFLAAYDPRRFERPSVTVDVALLSAQSGALHALTVRRREHPYRGWRALPGGFVGMAESLDRAAARVLADKAGLRGVYLEQLYTFGDPRRDPRMRVISVAYCALVDPARFEEAANTSADVEAFQLRVSWEGERGGPVALLDADGAPQRLGFDHAEILGTAVKRLRGKLNYSPIGFQLLPARFTLLQLQQVHETILGRKLDKNAFRRRMLATGQLQTTGESEREVDHRPAELFTFTSPPESP